MNASIDPILRLRDALRASGKTRSTWYADIAAGLAPRPVSIGARAVGWPCSELQALNKARVAGRSDAEIRRLVDQMHAARVKGFDIASSDLRIGT